MDEREETLAERMHREGWRTHPTGNVVRSVDGEEQSMWPHRELYEAMCDLEWPQPHAHTIKNCQICRGPCQEWGARLTCDACNAGPEASMARRVQELEELLESSDAAFARQRDRAEDADSLVERLQERIRELEQQRGEPVGWAAYGSSGYTTVWHCEETAREVAGASGRVARLYAGPPEPAEKEPALTEVTLGAKGHGDRVAVARAARHAAAAPGSFRPAGGQDMRAGHDAGDEDDYDGKVL